MGPTALTWARAGQRWNAAAAASLSALPRSAQHCHHARPGSESQLARATTRLELLLLLLPAAGGSDDNPHHTHSLTVLACCDLPVTFKPVTPSILSSSGFPPACAAIKIHLIVPFLEENRPLLLLLRLAFPTPAKLRQASTTRSYAPHRVAK